MRENGPLGCKARVNSLIESTKHNGAFRWICYQMLYSTAMVSKNGPLIEKSLEL